MVDRIVKVCAPWALLLVFLATAAPVFVPAVMGPASATDLVPALFDGTTGKLIKNSTPTGTGNPVLQTSPALTTPALGTPTSGTLTNTTGFPVSGLAGAGSGILTWLGVPSFANFIAALTNSQLPYDICSTSTPSTTTNSATEQNRGICTIPANLMGTNGSLYIRNVWRFVGVANTKTVTIRISATSGDTSGGTVFRTTVAAAPALTSATAKTLNESGSATNAQVFVDASVSSDSVGSAVVMGSAAIDTTAAWYVNFNCAVTNSADTCRVENFSVTFHPVVCVGTAPSC